MYKILRPLLFRRDPEQVHHMTFRWIRRVFAVPGMAALARWIYSYQGPGKTLFGIHFPNPVGLAAGFDKNALLLPHWGNFGFGFVEIGTVTPRPQAGNPLPRLFRLPEDQAIINRMGFNNDGLDAIVARLRAPTRRRTIIGGNIGKNKDTPNETAADDYRRCFEALHPYVDYFVVNVSSPNTPGLRELQEKEPLARLLGTLQTLNAALPQPRPILLKIAPDLSDSQLDDILDIVQTTGIAGLVATNTTISRAGLHTAAATLDGIGAGGLSGAPLRGRALEVIRYLRAKGGPGLPIIAVGGIMTPEDAQARMDAGADLLQLYTGFVYAGPSLPKRICRQLARHQ
jgi:dihydroorotate dehydrogenase